MIDPRIEPAKPFSIEEIAAIEAALGRKLPRAYTDFVARYGGAFVGGSLDGKGRFAILAFFTADNESGILKKLGAYPDLRDDGVLPIADCELGNLHVLRLDGSVWYLNYYGGRTSAERVADSFQDFVERIVCHEDG